MLPLPYLMFEEIKNELCFFLWAVTQRRCEHRKRFRYWLFRVRRKLRGYEFPISSQQNFSYLRKINFKRTLETFTFFWESNYLTFRALQDVEKANSDSKKCCVLGQNRGIANFLTKALLSLVRISSEHSFGILAKFRKACSREFFRANTDEWSGRG